MCVYDIRVSFSFSFSSYLCLVKDPILNRGCQATQVGDELVAVEGYDVPEWPTSEDGQKRFKVQLTKWLREAPRPMRLTFAQQQKATEAGQRGVPQAYVRARASSETLRSVHVSRVFLCIFYIKMGN